MMILIPTLGRVDKQITWDNLSPCVRKYATLVVAESEADQHITKGRRVLRCPVQGLGMATVRNWIMEWCTKNGQSKVVMIDDDIRLQKRGPDLRVVGKATDEEQLEILTWMWNSLDDYAHCALTERNAAWADEEEFQIATKGIQCVGYNVKKVLASGSSFNKDVPAWFFIEDYHMTLQLFEAGLPNIVSRLYRVDFGNSNAPGGCSKHRTPAKLEEAAKLLERLHPKYVKAVLKETKTSFGGGERWNVRVQWRKAYQDSKIKPTAKDAVGY